MLGQSSICREDFETVQPVACVVCCQHISADISAVQPPCMAHRLKVENQRILCKCLNNKSRQCEILKQRMVWKLGIHSVRGC